MRMIVFFDLPMVTTRERKAYGAFRKKLMREGFVMMQQSVYTKVVLHATNARLARARLASHMPPNGVVQLLTVTERQFAATEYLLGANTSRVIQTLDRTVIV